MTAYAKLEMDVTAKINVDWKTGQTNYLTNVELVCVVWSLMGKDYNKIVQKSLNIAFVMLKNALSANIRLV